MATNQSHADTGGPSHTVAHVMDSPIHAGSIRTSPNTVHNFSVEKAAHALRTRLALASAKVYNGWASQTLEDLESSVPSAAADHTKSLPSDSEGTPTDVDLVRSGGASFWSPPLHLEKPAEIEDRRRETTDDSLRPILADKRGVTPNDVHPQVTRSSPLDSSSSRSVQPVTPPRNNRVKSTLDAREKSSEPSIYAALFGPKFSSSALGKPFSPDGDRTDRQDWNASHSPARSASGRSHALLSSPQAFKGVASLLNCAAASPQLGSPDRINGPPYDPHNDPTLEQQAIELHSVFAPPQSPLHRAQDGGSHSKRRRTAAADAAAGLHETSPARARSWATSSPAARQRHANSAGLLSNGHRASSLAQGLGLARTPGTPSRGHRSHRSESRTRERAAVDVEMDDPEQDDTDRAAELLAAMAEDRNVASSSRTPGRAFSETTSPRMSYGASARTSPWSDRQTAAALTSPSVRALGSATRTTSRPQTPDSSLRGSLAGSRATPTASVGEDPRTPNAARRKTSRRVGADDSAIGRDDDEAARLMLFLASSPSNSQESAKSRTTALGKAPSQLREVNPSNDIQPASQPSKEAGSKALFQDDASMQDEQRSTHSQQSVGSSASDDTAISSLLLHASDSQPQGNVESHTSAPTSQGPSLLASQMEDGGESKSSEPVSSTSRVATPPRASQTSTEGTPPPRTPPLPPSTPRTPNAPGSSFSYGDFLNVSPSPQPRASIRLGPSGAGSHTPRAMARNALLTPSRGGGDGKTSGRFLDFAEMVDVSQRGEGGSTSSSSHGVNGRTFPSTPSSAAALSRMTGSLGSGKGSTPVSAAALHGLAMDLDGDTGASSLQSSPMTLGLGNVHLTPSRKRARVVSVEDALGARLD